VATVVVVVEGGVSYEGLGKMMVVVVE